MENQSKYLEKIKSYKNMVEKQFFMEDYEDYDQTRRFLLLEEPINLHACCLLLHCFSKLLSMLSDELCLIKEGPISRKSVSKIFVLIQRIYLSDQMLYQAMRAPVSDLFYQPEDSADWKLYSEISE